MRMEIGYHLSTKMTGYINFTAHISIGDYVKFGRNVKFIVDDELLKEYEIASDVQRLSELFDTIRSKSNNSCIEDILSTIKSSLDSEKE